MEEKETGEYTLVEPTKEESEALTNDLQEVLKKHNAEMGIVSTIQLLKRVPKIPSPYQNEDTPKDNKSDAETEESS